MKKALLLFVIIATMAACKKENQATPGMFGTWELRQVQGGWGALQVYGVGNGNRYQFNSDSSYAKHKNGVIESQGKFSLNIIAKERGFNVGSIKFTKPDYSDAFQIKQDTIYIGTSAADGPTFLYIKLK